MQSRRLLALSSVFVLSVGGCGSDNSSGGTEAESSGGSGGQQVGSHAGSGSDSVGDKGSGSGGATAGAAKPSGGASQGGASNGAGGSTVAQGGSLASAGTKSTGGPGVDGGAGRAVVGGVGGNGRLDAAVGTGGGTPGGSKRDGAAAGGNGTSGTSGAGGSSEAGSEPSGKGPCDIYAAGNTPCVAAHSTVRALYGAYNGKLYQVQRASDKTTKDIVALAAGGFADSASQDTFCSGTSCTISIIYDQSPKGNDLTPAPGGGAAKTADKPVDANKLKLKVGGHSVYGAYFEGGMGYRNNSKTTGLAKNDEPESMYMVASGKHHNDKCCWDYGNAETTNNDDGEGTMEAIYFGDCTSWGKGSGNGPWVMADIENGLWAGNVTPNSSNTPLTPEYLIAMVKGKPHTFAIKGGDATTGTLKTMWEGAYPAKGATGKPYDPMKKQGAIILGIGGDNSNGGVGTFFEGCITTGYSSNETDEAIQANIVAAGYGK